MSYAGYIPSKVTVVKHLTRDIAFILPQVDSGVGFLESNYKNRLATAMKWAGKEAQTVDIENGFMTGFSIETLNGRYHTEVEYVLVRHPEGYVFEVPFQNLLDILKVSGCGVGGIIEAPCKLFASGGKWRIFPQGTNLEDGALEADKTSRKFVADKKKNANKKFVVGQVVKLRDMDGYWVYAGKKLIGANYDVHEEFFKDTSNQYPRADKITSVASCKVVIDGSVCTSSGVCDGVEFEVKKSLPMLDECWMTFVRIPNVSKTDSISNEEFMLRSYRQGGPEPEIVLFKSKSVQFQPTDEFDHGTLEHLSVTKFKLCSTGGSKNPWDLLNGWDSHLRTVGSSGFGYYNTIYPQELLVGKEPNVGQVYEKGVEIGHGGRFYVDQVYMWSGRHVGYGKGKSTHSDTLYSIRG
jgi:hypothetical protein